MATRARASGSASTPRATLSIGELAEQAGLSTRTIRYYEELGILPPPERTTGGTRRYSRDYFFYLEGTRILKQLGFELEEIAELGRSALTGASASTRTQVILQEKVAQLDRKIRVLHRLYELVSEAATSTATSNTSTSDLLRWVSARNSDFAEDTPNDTPDKTGADHGTHPLR